MVSVREIQSLLSESLDIVQGQDLPSLWFIFLFGVLFAAGSWVGAVMFAKLWNRKYQLRPWHHLLCGIAAVATLIVTVTWPITTYVMTATNAVDQLWQRHLAADENWQQQTFTQAYEAVRRLDLEDFSSIPPPSILGSRIPLTDPASVQAVASVYVRASSEYFRKQFPQLGMFLQQKQEGEAIDFDTGLQSLLEESGVVYPLDQTARYAASGLTVILLGHVQGWIWKVRLVTVGLFLTLQVLSFGLIGFAAYRNIKVHL